MKELTEYEAYKQINELFGGMVSHPAPGLIEVLPTGSPSLDRAIGVGGWPFGRLIQLAGKEGSGKTFMAMLAMAKWQSMDPDNCVAFLDAENGWQANWAEALGIDYRRLLYVGSNEASVLFQGLIGKVKKNKQTGKITKVSGLFDMIQNDQPMVYKNPLTNEKTTLQCGKMGVITLDSIAAIQTPLEMESDPGKQNYAAIARFLSAELKKLTPGIAHSNVIMFGINQVRVKMDVMYGNPEDTPGGKALKHACSLMVEFARKTGADNLIVDSAGDKIGNRIRAKVTKNRMAPEGRLAEYLVRYDHGVVNRAEELLDVGCHIGYIEKPNNRSYVIGEEKLTSRANAIEFLENNMDFYEDDIRKTYIEAVSDYQDEQLNLDEEVPENPFDGEDEEE